MLPCDGPYTTLTDLIFYWTFDNGSAEDASGNNNAGQGPGVPYVCAPCDAHCTRCAVNEACGGTCCSSCAAGVCR